MLFRADQWRWLATRKGVTLLGDHVKASSARFTNLTGFDSAGIVSEDGIEV